LFVLCSTRHIDLEIFSLILSFSLSFSLTRTHILMLLIIDGRVYVSNEYDFDIEGLEHELSLAGISQSPVCTHIRVYHSLYYRSIPFMNCLSFAVGPEIPSHGLCSCWRHREDETIVTVFVNPCYRRSCSTLCLTPKINTNARENLSR
jgi:hypothetical protein